MNPQILQDLHSFYPEVILTVALMLVVLADSFLGKSRKAVGFLMTAAALSLAFAAAVAQFGTAPRTLFFGMVALDNMSVFFKGFLLAASFLVLVVAPGAREFARSGLGEFYALLLGVTLGMLLLASSVDVLMVYLTLETVSIGSYVMVGYLRHDRLSNEASLKYLLFGAVSSGAMLYGMTILFGLAGTTKLIPMRDALAAGPAGNSWALLVAAVLVLAGFGFKTASVPFHFWCPDVYTGAPTPVTAFLSVAPKAAGFATLIRFFYTGMASPGAPEGNWASFQHLNWTWLILVLSVLTMTVGNLSALRQDNLKRMLAYSSIAHAGYLLMGAVVLNAEGLQAILIYLITYLFMNLGAFVVVIEIYNLTGSFDIREYRGFHRRSPFLTIAMTVFMLSLMGIPPFAGFFGKLFVFGAAVNRDLAWFAVIGALNSVIAVYYYARVIKAMIIEQGESTEAVRISPVNGVLVWAMLLPTAGLLIFWEQIQHLTG